MKKVLFATTALIAATAAAQADIVITGSAEMGVVGGDIYGLSEPGTNIINGNDDMRFHQGYTINFAMTSVTDSGLEFGANVRYDSDGTTEENQGPTMDGGTVFISGSFGTLTMGDTDGAADWALGEMSLGGGAINDAHTTHIGYNGMALLDGSHDDQVLRYNNTVGALGYAVSYEQASQGQSTALDDNTAVGVTYSMDMGGDTLDIGVGYMGGSWYSDTGATDATALASAYTDAGRTVGEYRTGDAIGISAVYTSATGFTLGANAAQLDFDNTRPNGDANTLSEITWFGVGAAYETGNWTLAANYGTIDADFTDTADIDGDGYGVTVNYDLGGGATFQAGYGSSSADAALSADYDSASVGIAMSF